ncbi:putative uncharacterized domain protein [Xanthomonas citri pv. mangiferaeindicae LMG 941]|nr:putative uncharacterized domain protein [Xanthomonas citri pv. mangiferaeindicae LMG 941]
MHAYRRGTRHTCIHEVSDAPPCPLRSHADARVITTVRCRRPGESGIQVDHRRSGSASQWPSLVSMRDASPPIHKQQTRRLAAATACRSASKIAGVRSRIRDEAIGGMKASSELAWMDSRRASIDQRMAPADACVNHQHSKTQTTTVQAICAGNPHPNEADAATTAVAVAAADRRHALQPRLAARHVPSTLTHDVNTSSGGGTTATRRAATMRNAAHLAHANSRLCASAVPQRAGAGLPVPATSRLWANREHLNAARLAPCHPLL